MEPMPLLPNANSLILSGLSINIEPIIQWVLHVPVLFFSSWSGLWCLRTYSSWWIIEWGPSLILEAPGLSPGIPDTRTVRYEQTQVARGIESCAACVWYEAVWMTFWLHIACGTSVCKQPLAVWRVTHPDQKLLWMNRCIGKPLIHTSEGQNTVLQACVTWHGFLQKVIAAWQSFQDTH